MPGGKTEFERAYSLLIATLGVLDALNLPVPAVHVSSAIDAMERDDLAQRCDLAALRRLASHAGSDLH